MATTEPEYRDEEFINALRSFDPPVAAQSELADEVGCHVNTVRTRLNSGELAERVIKRGSHNTTIYIDAEYARGGQDE